jgi:hypothetical protein
MDDLERAKNNLQVPARLIELLHALPSGYLDYFYLQNEIIAHQQSGIPTRAEVVMDVERRLLERYADVHLCEKPAGANGTGRGVLFDCGCCVDLFAPPRRWRYPRRQCPQPTISARLAQ